MLISLTHFHLTPAPGIRLLPAPETAEWYLPCSCYVIRCQLARNSQKDSAGVTIWTIIFTYEHCLVWRRACSYTSNKASHYHTAWKVRITRIGVISQSCTDNFEFSFLHFKFFFLTATSAGQSHACWIQSKLIYHSYLYNFFSLPFPFPPSRGKSASFYTRSPFERQSQVHWVGWKIGVLCYLDCLPFLHHIFL